MGTLKNLIKILDKQFKPCYITNTTNESEAIMIAKIGDMVGFKYKEAHHLAIIIDDLGEGTPFGRYTGVLLDSSGDYVPLCQEEITVLKTPHQVEQWERRKKVFRIMKKNDKNT